MRPSEKRQTSSPPLRLPSPSPSPTTPRVLKNLLPTKSRNRAPHTRSTIAIPSSPNYPCRKFINTILILQPLHKSSPPHSFPEILISTFSSFQQPEKERPAPAMYNPATQLPPGFRFHPTDDELIVHYLRNRTAASSSPASIIAEVDIYKFDPWDLPEKAVFGDKEWYFFTPRDRKYPNGVRPNRAAVTGYWKATGTDKAISYKGNCVGVKKALVFYKGKPPKGVKTNWIMHEYRLSESQSSNNYRPLSVRLIDHSMRLDDWVLCRIYNKGKHLPPPLLTDQKNSCTDDTSLPTQSLPQQHALLLNLPKADYLEDFTQLSNVFNSPLNLPRLDKNQLFGRPTPSLQQTNHDNNATANDYFLPQLSQMDSSVPSLGLKHQKYDERNCNEETAGSLHSFSGQSLLNQSFFTDQLLMMNSHFGLQ